MARSPSRTTTSPRSFATRPGTPHPLGATVGDGGVNFSVFSQSADGIDLLLFDKADDGQPAQIIHLSPDRHRTFHFWHVFVVGAQAGQSYAYRVHGPWAPDQGYRFNPDKVLIDPYALGNSTALWRRGDACGDADNLATSLRSVVVDPALYDWGGDRPLGRPIEETIIYEMHVGGFTRSPSAGVTAKPGTFRALTEKIGYLKDLGVTAVELMPIFQFDDSEVREVDGRKLTNYWGYSTMSYFSPHSGYCDASDAVAQLDEFRDMVKEFHAAGIEIFLDVVFNHTDEGNHLGPTYSFKGIDNKNYYYLVNGDEQYYYDYTGCGNTFNCNHPIGVKLIVDSLKFWVKETHVDGFRFDEGSVLSRGPDGAPMAYPPVLWSIELDDALAGAKVVAEAWDAAGLYQIGHFPGFRWGEWNGRYRDDLRRFVKGDPGIIGAVAARLAGSADLYQWSGHQPVNSVNFVTAHDGFTLNDLVSYNGKHNDANGEGNRDGVNDNMSWNCGVEGPTDDGAIEALRDRQIKNFATLLLISQGVPMIVMGDEVRRTQNGNNNAYCHDNDISWFDWSLVEKNKDILRFWQQMIRFRLTHKAVHRRRYYTGAVNDRGVPDVSWHGTELDRPGWNDGDARVLGMTLGGFDGEADIHVMANMYWGDLEMAVPTVAGRVWKRVVDTSLAAPADIAAPGSESTHDETTYQLAGRSVVVLISQ